MAQTTIIEERTRTLAEPLLAAEGLELLDVEFVREQGGWILRIFIDKLGAEVPAPAAGGTPASSRVGVEECAIASHVLGPALDVEDFISQAYSLELSSPGINRPLKKKGHYERVIGQKVRLKTFGPLFDPPRKNFLGELKQVADAGITLAIEGAGELTIAFKDIAKANLEVEL